MESMTPKLSWLIALTAGAVIIILTFFLPGGQDLYTYYLPFANGCLTCGFTPYFAQWLLWPLTLLPPALAYPLWTAVSVFGFIFLCRYTGANPAVVILSFAALGEFWLGQIDIIIAVGLVLALLAKNPYWRGVGLVLAMVKPQLAGLAVLMLILQQPRHELIKVLAAPLLTLAASFMVYGLAWPLAWLANSLASLPIQGEDFIISGVAWPLAWLANFLVNLPAQMWQLAGWAFGLGLILILFILKRRLTVDAALIIAALATPFFRGYSYIVFLIFRSPWWSLPLSYAWLLLYPLLGAASARAAWLLPAGLLIYLVYKDTKSACHSEAVGRRIPYLLNYGDSSLRSE